MEDPVELSGENAKTWFLESSGVNASDSGFSQGQVEVKDRERLCAGVGPFTLPLLRPQRSPLERAFPRASGTARETAIALAGIDEPRMPIYCARQPLWSRGTSGWSQPLSARGQRSAAAS
ncbi:hypothetical protein NN561_012652 [Cricetulus griseus]